ncbi:MAG: hypothetical protein IJF78_06500 [Clostridia bacterium]|nr:hypothetical protein [Clostridia bacterium]
MERIKWPDRKKLTVILMAAAGIALILLGNLGGKKETTEYTDVKFYTEYLEERVRKLCVSVEGIEEAAVFLTLDCSSEYVYSETGASDVLILTGSSGEEAVLLQEIYPRVRGVAVVCTGGDLPRIRETVTELLSAALDLPSHRIKVAGS